ncbi:MAG: hypothetical protein ACRDL7_04010 [Gaiellaceae bacterium]
MYSPPYNRMEDRIELLAFLRANNFPVLVTGTGGVLHASLGPFPPERVHAADSEGSLDLQRVLDTVCDSHEVEERDGAAWVELTKRIAA